MSHAHAAAFAPTATAEVSYANPSTGELSRTARSPSPPCGGVESNSDEPSFQSLENEQIAEAEAVARETASQIAGIPFLTSYIDKKRSGRAAAR